MGTVISFDTGRILKPSMQVDDFPAIDRNRQRSLRAGSEPATSVVSFPVSSLSFLTRQPGKSLLKYFAVGSVKAVKVDLWLLKSYMYCL